VGEKRERDKRVTAGGAGDFFKAHQHLSREVSLKYCSPDFSFHDEEGWAYIGGYL
jgi:hypothetical protein